jgi:nitrite reductase/ring-hydroxylating ferredoxin subunit
MLHEREAEEIQIGASADVPEGDGILVSLTDGREVGVFRVDGQVVAYENSCAHQGGPVCTGDILGRYLQVLAPDKTVLREEFSTTELHLVCPWHGWEYRLDTGECAVNPRYRLRRVPVAERDGLVFLEA